MEKNVYMDGTGAMAAQSPVSEPAAVSTVTVARRPGKNVRVLKREQEPMLKTESISKAETKRVAAYCRISTDKEEQESSLQVQMESFRRQIEERPGWALVDIYVDEGITGTQAKRRDAFNRMIADCEAGKIDKTIIRLIQKHDNKSAVKPLFLGGFFIFGASAA